MDRRASQPGAAAARRRALVTAALLIVVSLAAIAFYAWFSFAGSEMTASGYIALSLGVIGTIALAVGLMSLVYFSDRYGYDDAAGGGEAKRREGDRP